MRRYVVMIHLLVGKRMVSKRWLMFGVSAMAACSAAEREALALG